MLTYEMQGDVLHVTETICGFTSTKISHIYYDTKNWLVSSRHTLGAKPDWPMCEASIAWVKKYYLPKVGVEA